MYHATVSCSCSKLDLVLSRLGGQGGLIKVIKVGVEDRLLSGDPLGRIVDEHLLQEVVAEGINLLHAILQSHRRPIGETRLKKNKILIQ